jgi:acyl carrier protein
MKIGIKMTKEKIIVELNHIFTDVFMNENISLTQDTIADDIQEWDSFSNIELILNIEEHFNIKFNLKELRNLENIGNLAEYILKKVK